MMKTLMLAAFAAVSVCAMAQDTWRDDDRRGIDATGKNHYEIKKMVCWQEQYLSGGDAYDFENLLNRMNGNAEDALISGLFAAHRQATLIRDQMISAKLPVDATLIVDAPGANNSNIMAMETEMSMRPMKMVIQGARPIDIDYDTAFDILAADLTATQRTQLAMWWDGGNLGRGPEGMDDNNSHAKDIIVRLLKIDARRADDPIYTSVYTHRMYSMMDSK